MAKEYSVIVDGVAPAGIRGTTHIVNILGADRNLAINHHWAARLPRGLNDDELDWLTIMETCFAVDRVCRREHSREPEGWTRRIWAGIPLRNPEKWRPHLRRIQEVFGHLTSDSLSLEAGASSARRAPRQTQRVLPEIDAVALLSGGVDSFVGGARLLARGERVAFLSHSPGGATSRAQKDLRSALSGVGNAEFVSFTITPKRSGDHPFPRQLEDSERSRTLLYLGVAIILAKVMEISHVYINENGIMAIHAPIAAARVGSYSTKTAAPSILRRIQDVANRALSTDIRVSNLLLAETKAEVVSSCPRPLRPHLKRTVSCWSIGRRGEHCGLCIPCLVRRVAFRQAGVADCAYATDVFNLTAPPSEWAKDNLYHFLEFAEDLVAMDDALLEMRYGELIEEAEGLSAEQCREMHRRWGQQMQHVLTAAPISIP